MKFYLSQLQIAPHPSALTSARSLASASTRVGGVRHAANERRKAHAEERTSSDGLLSPKECLNDTQRKKVLKAIFLCERRNAWKKNAFHHSTVQTRVHVLHSRSLTAALNRVLDATAFVDCTRSGPICA